MCLCECVAKTRACNIGHAQIYNAAAARKSRHTHWRTHKSTLLHSNVVCAKNIIIIIMRHSGCERAPACKAADFVCSVFGAVAVGRMKCAMGWWASAQRPLRARPEKPSLSHVAWDSRSTRRRFAA